MELAKHITKVGRIRGVPRDLNLVVQIMIPYWLSYRPYSILGPKDPEFTRMAKLVVILNIGDVLCNQSSELIFQRKS